MPNPMNQATNMNEAHLMLAKWRSTGIHSGIWRVVCAKTLLCFAHFNQSKRSINSGKVSMIRFISFILCPVDSLTRRSSLLWSCDGVEIRAAAEQVSDDTRSQEPEERKERSKSIRD